MRAYIAVTNVSAALDVLPHDRLVGKLVPGYSAETTTLVVDDTNATAVTADGSLKLWLDGERAEIVNHDDSAVEIDPSVLGPVPVVGMREPATRFEHEIPSGSSPSEIQPVLGAARGEGE